MTTIIVCACVIVFIALFSEIRIGIRETQNAHLKALITDREKRYNSLHTLSENMLGDYEAMYEAMLDHFTDDEIDIMVYDKKRQLEELEDAE